MPDVCKQEVVMTIRISSSLLTWLLAASIGSFFGYHLLKYVEIFKAVVN